MIYASVDRSSRSEVTHTARSVARWTRRNITPEQTATNRHNWGTHLSQKAAEKRSSRVKALREAALGGHV